MSQTEQVRLRTTPLFLFFLATSPAQAEINVRLLATTGSKNAVIEMTVPVRKTEKAVTFQLPRWRPGWYSLQDHAKRLIGLEFIDASGKKLTPTSPDNHTWQLKGAFDGQITVRYAVPWENTEGVVGLSGPEAFLYVVGRKEESHKLRVDVPPSWKIAIGLSGEGPTYRASSYDVLIDNPITLGDFIEERYTVRGKEHVIALYGVAKGDVNRGLMKETCRRITETQAEFFGGLPYDKYVWHFDAGPGSNWAGGLEHLSSTQISHAADIGTGVKSVYSHEFFHLWNVKRIRTSVLGPFDYTKLPRTGALWWLEGVTDYYADYLLKRGQVFDEATYLDQVCRSIEGQRANPKRLEVSPYDSSLRVDETDGGKGNSTGYGVSYYETGYVAGLCLDLAILEATQLKKSLDDVTLGLWKRSNDIRKPGLPETAIREELVRVGGSKLGELYDQWILKPGDFPIEAMLAKLGMELVPFVEKRVDLGFVALPLGNKLLVEGVSNTKLDLKKGDRVMMEGKAWNQLLNPELGDRTVEVPILRDGVQVRVSVPIKVSQRSRTRITSKSNPTADQLAMRKAWLERSVSNRKR